MQRITVPVIDGMISSTLLMLIAIPAIYGLIKGYRIQEAVSAPASQSTFEVPR